MTQGAPIAHDFVFEDERPRLRGMAFRAGRIDGGRECFRPADRGVRVSFVRIVTTRTRNLALEDRMCVREAEFRAIVDVTLHACTRRCLRIDDRGSRSRLDVKTRRTVAGLARDVLWFPVIARHHEVGVSRIMKPPRDIRVAFHARFRADD